MIELEQNRQQILNTKQSQQQEIFTLQKCLDIVKNIISEEDSATKLESWQIFRELQLVSTKFTDYIQTESTFDSQQKLLQERKVTIESDYQTKTKSYKEAAEKERESESLKTDLDALLAKAPAVNWYEPEVINLLARLQPYINAARSAQELTKTVSVVREIATEFGLKVPEHGLFGLAGWLHNAISAQLPSIRTALSYANDAATAMANVDSAAQTLMENRNLIAQLQEESPKITEERTRLSKKLNNLHLCQSEISLATNEIQEWSDTAYLRLYETINRCFQQERSLTEDLLQLPLHLVARVNTNETNHTPWESSLSFGNNKLHKLINQYREWKEVSRIAHSIYLMLEEARNLVNVKIPSFHNKVTDKFFDVIAQKINPLNPLHGIEKLQILTKKTLIDVKKQPGIWGWSIEVLSGQSRRELLALKLRAIAKQCNVILTRTKPQALEPILKRITDEAIEGIITSSHQFLDRTKVEIDREIQQIQARLNELENYELQISKQISTAQELVEKTRDEGKHNISQVSTLLKQMTELPILPKPLGSLAEQHLQPSDIRRLAPDFLGQVNYYQNRFSELEVLIAKLDPFTVLSNINDLIAVDLDSCRKITETLSQQIKTYQHQLQEIDVQLQQNVENLQTQRYQVKTEIEGLLERLPELTSKYFK